MPLSVFCNKVGNPLLVSNFEKRVFHKLLRMTGLRRLRFHILRHTFASRLLQNGESPVYVKDQMGHSSVQVTVDIYGHLIPGANVSFVDKLDTPKPETAPNPHQTNRVIAQIPPQVVDLVGGGGWTRTSDLRIMRPSL